MASYTPARTASGATVGGYVFAGTALLMIGIFQALAGIAAIIEDDFFVLGKKYAFEVDVTSWGWIHLALGVVVALAGYGLFTAQTWARVVGVTVAVISAIANFFFMPYYPFWAITIIGLDVWVIWALTRSLDVEERV
jgi:hypothetical protein